MIVAVEFRFLGSLVQILYGLIERLLRSGRRTEIMIACRDGFLGCLHAVENGVVLRIDTLIDHLLQQRKSLAPILCLHSGNSLIVFGNYLVG